MYLNGTIEGPWLSSRGSCGWYLRPRCLAGCVLPKFPVIIIIWKFHETSLFSFQQEFRSTHQNTNVYDPGNNKIPPCWTSQLITLFLKKNNRTLYNKFYSYILKSSLWYLRPYENLLWRMMIVHTFIFGPHWL